MASVNPRALFAKLNEACRRALEGAAGLCLSRTHFHVELEHLLLKLMEPAGNDLGGLFKHYEIDAGKVKRELEAALGKFKTGNGRAPDLSLEILDAMQAAWVTASLEYDATALRSAHVLAGMLGDRQMSYRLGNASPELNKLIDKPWLKELPELLNHLTSGEREAASAAKRDDPSPAGAVNANSKTPSLDQFTTNLTEQAKQGKIDRILGRDAEIRQVIDVLTRRRQNNPILTGEAGVGKTAVVEGLALRIVQGDVPEPLKTVQLRTLDLGLLQAGAGVKGEFENRLKNVIQEVKSSPIPIVLFIDEAHTLIGAGGTAGQNDAANLLKPALARGELRTIAATTFDEYKKSFEGDPALKRRFQEVRVEEPDEPKAVRMLRAVADAMQKHHGVRILDEAISAAVRLGIRYLPERQLPDKAVSLLDTASARVKLSQGATPAPLEDATREIEHLTLEIEALERERDLGSDHEERLTDLRKHLASSEAIRNDLATRLEQERGLVASIAKAQAAADMVELKRLHAELERLQGELPLVHPLVDAAIIGSIVSGWTGIPLGAMVRNELQTVLALSDKLSSRVIGQDHALQAIAERIRTSRADLADPRRPVGVFLLVGPSGVGKTETALALADLLYGGDRNMITINMSEFKEEYKVSQLLGSPRGYEGSEEGGILTEAVRRRPYSVVLLDEVEKSHPSVQEIFYQVFDKGILADSRGIEVNFKNTIILLTSNVGTDTFMKVCADPDTMPNAAGLAEMIRPDLLKAFKPALLGRMTIVPYFPLSEAVLHRIIALQLHKIAERLRLNHKATLEYDPAVIAAVAARCKEVESGARNVDHILTSNVLPVLSREILARQAEGKPLTKVKLSIGADGQFMQEIE